MAKPFDICIRGSGIVGRTLALHLAARQLRVALVEAPVADGACAETLAKDVRAFALNNASRQLLQDVRCWPAETDATPVTTMQVQADGTGQVTFQAADQGAEALNWIVDVPALQDQLAQAVKFQPFIEVCTTPPVASLTVVCEGRDSQSREAFGIALDITPYGQSAIACRVRLATPHHQTAYQWCAGGDILAFLPVGGADGSEFAVVWSVATARAAELMHVSEAEFCTALGAASHQPTESLSLSGPRASWPLQHAQAQRWTGQGVQGAWVLAGDAAHTVHPLAGQGLNIGLADVAELVRVLDAKPYWRNVGDPRLLRQYERARKADFALMGQANDTLQQLLTRSNPTLHALRNWGMNQFDKSGLMKQWVASRAMGLADRLAKHP